MLSRTENQARDLLDTLTPDLLRLLSTAPAFGSCGIDVVFHEGKIVRLVFRGEVSRKPKAGR